RPGTAVRLRPSPPRGVGAKSESFEKAQIQWRQSPEPEVRGYLVHRSDKLDGQYRVIAKLEGRGVESYLDSGEAGARLQGGMRYFYRLKSFNSSGALSDMSVTASTVILGGPKPPEGILGHSGLIRKNRLTWIPNTDPDTEGYRIYRSQVEAGAYSLIDELPDPRAGEYLDSARPEDGHPFEEGAVYWYKVLAYDKRGRVGEMSAAASASSMPKPPAPSNLRLESAGDGAFTLAWDLSQLPDVAGYRLYRSASKDGVFEMVAQIDGGATAHYTDAGTRESKLRSDIDYYYKLTLFNQAGAESDMSAAVVASSDKPLAPPSHLQATVGLEGRIIVSWEPSRDPSVDGYIIYRGATPREAERIQALPGRETRSFQDYGGEGATLPPGTVYYYSVRPATSEGVEGESAEWARGATKTLLSAVEDLKAQLKKSGEVTLGWTAPRNGEASGYRIFRSTGGGQFLELAVCAENYFTDPSPGPEPAGAEYKVQAIDMDGVAGALSGAAAVSPKPAPLAPTGLQASPGRSSVALSWDPHPDREVAGYNLFQSREGAMVKIATTKNTAWLAEDLAPDTEYQFAVSAVDNENVEGASCLPVKARTLP
ncbi:MAG: fibronectin type III domain-containing protein, partial [Nitrospinota bacterium]|nr:fibronectin type III domain-containing protein [Nitrospinota bacterium]